MAPYPYNTTAGTSDKWFTRYFTTATGGDFYAYEGTWYFLSEASSRAKATPEIEDRHGFRQRPGSRPAHKSVIERISRKPRVLD